MLGLTGIGKPGGDVGLLGNGGMGGGALGVEGGPGSIGLLTMEVEIDMGEATDKGAIEDCSEKEEVKSNYKSL